MHTVHSLVKLLTDPKFVMQQLRDILREVDPEYEKEEQAFITGCSALSSGIDDSVVPNVQSYLNALEEEMTSDIIFVIGRGIKLNLDIHRNPVNALAFKLDYEDLHEERKMHMLPIPSLGELEDELEELLEAM